MINDSYFGSDLFFGTSDELKQELKEEQIIDKIRLSKEEFEKIVIMDKYKIPDKLAPTTKINIYEYFCNNRGHAQLLFEDYITNTTFTDEQSQIIIQLNHICHDTQESITKELSEYTNNFINNLLNVTTIAYAFVKFIKEDIMDINNNDALINMKVPSILTQTSKLTYPVFGYTKSGQIENEQIDIYGESYIFCCNLIKKHIEKNKYFYWVGGWSANHISNSGHSIGIIVHQYNNNNYTVAILNSGDGTRYHSTMNIGHRNIVSSTIKFDNVPEYKLDGFLLGAFICFHIGNLDLFYELCVHSLADYYNAEFFLPYTSQLSGGCTLRSIMMMTFYTCINESNIQNINIYQTYLECEQIFKIYAMNNILKRETNNSIDNFVDNYQINSCINTYHVLYYCNSIFAKNTGKVNAIYNVNELQINNYVNILWQYYTINSHPKTYLKNIDQLLTPSYFINNINIEYHKIYEFKSIISHKLISEKSETIYNDIKNIDEINEFLSNVPVTTDLKITSMKVVLAKIEIFLYELCNRKYLSKISGKISEKQMINYIEVLHTLQYNFTILCKLLAFTENYTILTRILFFILTRKIFYKLFKITNNIYHDNAKFPLFPKDAFYIDNDVTRHKISSYIIDELKEDNSFTIKNDIPYYEGDFRYGDYYTKVTECFKEYHNHLIKFVTGISDSYHSGKVSKSKIYKLFITNTYNNLSDYELDEYKQRFNESELVYMLINHNITSAYNSKHKISWGDHRYLSIHLLNICVMQMVNPLSSRSTISYHLNTYGGDIIPSIPDNKLIYYMKGITVPPKKSNTFFGLDSYTITDETCFDVISKKVHEIYKEYNNDVLGNYTYLICDKLTKEIERGCDILPLIAFFNVKNISKDMFMINDKYHNEIITILHKLFDKLRSKQNIVSIDTYIVSIYLMHLYLVISKERQYEKIIINLLKSFINIYGDNINVYNHEDNTFNYVKYSVYVLANTMLCYLQKKYDNITDLVHKYVGLYDNIFVEIRQEISDDYPKFVKKMNTINNINDVIFKVDGKYILGPHIITILGDINYTEYNCYGMNMKFNSNLNNVKSSYNTFIELDHIHTMIVNYLSYDENISNSLLDYNKSSLTNILFGDSGLQSIIRKYHRQELYDDPKICKEDIHITHKDEEIFINAKLNTCTNHMDAFTETSIIIQQNDIFVDKYIYQYRTKYRTFITNKKTAERIINNINIEKKVSNKTYTLLHRDALQFLSFDDYLLNNWLFWYSNDEIIGDPINESDNTRNYNILIKNDCIYKLLNNDKMTMLRSTDQKLIGLAELINKISYICPINKCLFWQNGNTIYISVYEDNIEFRYEKGKFYYQDSEILLNEIPLNISKFIFNMNNMYVLRNDNNYQILLVTDFLVEKKPVNYAKYIWSSEQKISNMTIKNIYDQLKTGLYANSDLYKCIIDIHHTNQFIMCDFGDSLIYLLYNMLAGNLSNIMNCVHLIKTLNNEKYSEITKNVEILFDTYEYGFNVPFCSAICKIISITNKNKKNNDIIALLPKIMQPTTKNEHIQKDQMIMGDLTVRLLENKLYYINFLDKKVLYSVNNDNNNYFTIMFGKKDKLSEKPIHQLFRRPKKKYSYDYVFDYIVAKFNMLFKYFGERVTQDDLNIVNLYRDIYNNIWLPDVKNAQHKYPNKGMIKRIATEYSDRKALFKHGNNVKYTKLMVSAMNEKTIMTIYKNNIESFKNNSYNPNSKSIIGDLLFKNYITIIDDNIKSEKKIIKNGKLDNTIKRFEYLFGHPIRENQIILLDNIITEQHKYYQFLMGFGKSKVITPILVLYYLTIYDSIIIVVPEHLLYETEKVIINNYPLFDHVKIVTHVINQGTTNINFSGINKQVNIVSDTSLKIYLLNNVMNDKYKKLENTFIIFDEIDSIIDPIKAELNISESINDTIAEIDFICDIYYFLYDNMELIATPETIPHKYIEYIDTNDYKTKVIKLFTRFDKYKESDYVFWQEKKNTKPTLKKLLENDFGGLSNCNKQVLQIVYKLLNKIIPTVITKIHNKHFGLRQFNKFAIPYVSDNTPSLQSEFTDPLFTIYYTYLAYLCNGIKVNDIKNMFYWSISNCKLTLEYFISLWSNVTDLSGKELEKKFVNIVNDKNLIKYFIKYLCKTNMGIVNKQLNCSAYDLIDSNFCSTTVGFTGTPYLPYIIDTSCTKSNRGHFNSIHNYDGSLYKEQYSKVSNHFKSGNVFVDNVKIISSKFELDDIINIMSDKYNTLIDTDSVLLCFDQKDIVKRILKKTKKSYCIYIDNHDNILCMDNNYIITRYNPKNIKQENIAVYFDQRHTIGFDIKQVNTAAAIVLCKKSTRYRDLTQATYRMRALEQGQTIQFVIMNNDLTNLKKIELYEILLENEVSYGMSQELISRVQNCRTIYRNVTNNKIDSYYVENIIPEKFHHIDIFIKGDINAFHLEKIKESTNINITHRLNFKYKNNNKNPINIYEELYKKDIDVVDLVFENTNIKQQETSKENELEIHKVSLRDKFPLNLCNLNIENYLNPQHLSFGSLHISQRAEQFMTKKNFSVNFSIFYYKDKYIVITGEEYLFIENSYLCKKNLDESFMLTLNGKCIILGSIDNNTNNIMLNISNLYVLFKIVFNLNVTQNETEKLIKYLHNSCQTFDSEFIFTNLFKMYKYLFKKRSMIGNIFFIRFIEKYIGERNIGYDCHFYQKNEQKICEICNKYSAEIPNCKNNNSIEKSLEKVKISLPYIYTKIKTNNTFYYYVINMDINYGLSNCVPLSVTKLLSTENIDKYDFYCRDIILKVNDKYYIDAENGGVANSMIKKEGTSIIFNRKTFSETKIKKIREISSVSLFETNKSIYVYEISNVLMEDVISHQLVINAKMNIKKSKLYEIVSDSFMMNNTEYDNRIHDYLWYMKFDGNYIIIVTSRFFIHVHISNNNVDVNYVCRYEIFGSKNGNTIRVISYINDIIHYSINNIHQYIYSDTNSSNINTFIDNKLMKITDQNKVYEKPHNGYRQVIFGGSGIFLVYHDYIYIIDTVKNKSVKITTQFDIIFDKRTRNTEPNLILINEEILLCNVIQFPLGKNKDVYDFLFIITKRGITYMKIGCSDIGTDDQYSDLYMDTIMDFNIDAITNVNTKITKIKSNQIENPLRIIKKKMEEDKKKIPHKQPIFSFNTFNIDEKNIQPEQSYFLSDVLSMDKDEKKNPYKKSQFLSDPLDESNNDLSKGMSELMLNGGSKIIIPYNYYFHKYKKYKQKYINLKKNKK